MVKALYRRARTGLCRERNSAGVDRVGPRRLFVSARKLMTRKLKSPVFRYARPPQLPTPTLTLCVRASGAH
ncbi:hypothetical protein EVAR_51114_1 [Eumeta japonica]|uniref:Uncharacterized protein n=1 Tax=Eumeta variegata TaxID=151549 RepID=A0A4C1YCK0_EUMVA|nr:hypothetical protein EVAR_51114_1 [Eumeta japonica]